jgi:hypothetical protein
MDPDGDVLEFIWSFSNGTVLKNEKGHSSSFSRYLPDGENYTVFLNVDDGKGGMASASFTVEVEKSTLPPLTVSGDSTPMVLVITCIVAAIIAGIVALGLRRRGKRSASATCEPDS